MKKTIWMAMAILLAGSLLFPACKGKEGPAGPTGTSYTPPAPLCSSPTTYGLVATPGNADFSGGVLRGSPITLATDATAIRLSTHCSAAAVTGQVRMGIYSDNADTPANLIVQTSPVDLAPASWNAINLPYNVYLPAGKYWVVYLISDLNEMSYQSSAGAGNQAFANYAWAELPYAFPTASSGSNRYCTTVATCP